MTSTYRSVEALRGQVDQLQANYIDATQRISAIQNSINRLEYANKTHSLPKFPDRTNQLSLLQQRMSRFEADFNESTRKFAALETSLLRLQAGTSPTSYGSTSLPLHHTNDVHTGTQDQSSVLVVINFILIILFCWKTTIQLTDHFEQYSMVCQKQSVVWYSPSCGHIVCESCRNDRVECSVCGTICDSFIRVLLPTEELLETTNDKDLLRKVEKSVVDRITPMIRSYIVEELTQSQKKKKDVIFNGAVQANCNFEDRFVPALLSLLFLLLAYVVYKVLEIESDKVAMGFTNC
ncbi:hypothetical protein ABKN59_008923 [Abortiporus biennis]